MVTIYRDGSRIKQVLEVKKGKSYYDQLTGKRIEEDESDLPAIPKKRPTPQEAWGMRVRKKADVGQVYTSVFRDADGSPVEVFVNIGKTGGYVAGAAEVTGRLASRALKYGAPLEEIATDLIGISCGTPYGLGPESVLSAFDAVGKSLIEIAKAKQLTLPIGEDQEEKLEAVITPVEKSGDYINGNGHTNGYTNGNSIKVSNGSPRFSVEAGSGQNFQMTLSSTSFPSQKSLLTSIHEEQAIETKFNSCPDCGSPLVYAEGCRKCVNDTCGWSKCS